MADEAEDLVYGETTRWCYLDDWGCVFPPGQYISDRDCYMVPVRTRKDASDLIALLERVRERLPK